MSTVEIISEENTPKLEKDRFSVAVTLESSGELEVKTVSLTQPAHNLKPQSTDEILRVEESKEELSELVTESVIRRDLDKLFSRPTSPSAFERSSQFQVLTSEMEQLF